MSATQLTPGTPPSRPPHGMPGAGKSRSSLGGIDFERQRRPNSPAQPYHSRPRFGHRGPCPAGAGRLCPHHLPAVRRERRLDDYGQRRRVPRLCLRLRRTRPVARRHVGVPQQERVRRHRVRQLRRLLDRPRLVGRARQRSRRLRRQDPPRWRRRSTSLNHDLGWILLAFAIFNTLHADAEHPGEHGSVRSSSSPWSSPRSSWPSELHRWRSELPTGTIKFGGYVGVVTALVAWYTSAAGVSNGIAGKLRFPVGKPLLS